MTIYLQDFRKKSSQDTLVDRLTKEIASHLNDDQFGVDSLAQAVGMSRSSLHRKLHKRLGVSTSQFIREYRLKRALEILKQEEVTASEVAYRVGFSSATYFNTCFHKFYGYTPGEVKSKTTPKIGELNELTTQEKMIVLPSDSIKSKTKKGRVNKILLYSVMLLTIASGALHFYNVTSSKNGEAKIVENIIDEKSIAVLPLKNLTGNPDLDYVSDGMTDAIISRLTKINSIDKIIPFTSILPYKETNKTISEIATELGVEKVLQGNLQIAGDKIKINLQMIDGRSNYHLWAEEYVSDWKTDEIFIMQTEVVEGIAANMNAVIGKNELADIKKIPTKSKLAYSYYLQAEFQLNKYNATTYANAIPLFEKAIALDSNFVEAYRGLANVWSIGGLLWGNNDEQTAWSNAKSLFEKALKIEPTNKEVEEQLHFGYFYYDWNFKKVEQYYQRGLKDSLTDNIPPVNADYAIKTGRYLDAINAMDERILTNPSVGVLFCFKARALMSLDKTDEAIHLLNSSNSLYSDNFGYLGESAKHYFYLEEYEKSKIQLKKIVKQFPDYPPILMWLNTVYAQMDGNSEEVDQYLAELQNKYHDGSSGSPAWFIALFYCTLKDYENAFKWLQKSYERHETEMTWLREEPLLAPIRNDSRYKDLYEKVGFSKIGLPIKVTPENQSSM